MDRQLIREELIAEEGWRNKPYRCSAGYLTVGVGRNLDAKGLSDSEVQVLLTNDIEECWRGVVRELPWVTQLSDPRQRVICGWAFQLGLSGLLEFKQTLAAIKAGRYDEAAAMMLQSKWAQQTPARVKRLAAMMRAG